jgi:hypothetical protein
MSLLFDALAALGLGGQLMIAATLGLAAFYVLKTVRIGRTVGGALTSGAAYLVVALGIGAAAIALGWVDPDPSTAMQHVQTAMSAVWDAVGGWVVDVVTGALP